MDYSKMSDYEISKLVAKAIGGFLEEDFSDTHSVIFRRHGRLQYSFFEPCTNPSDAWPIILANKINIEFEGDVIGGQEEWWSIASWGRTAEEHQFFTDDNPLRAAMVVFLMVKESANVQGNPA